ncbi:hypothetical protein CLOM_g1267 [Closterium sp. NIES-68]|nr:hypothetical protein CLOM_g1267 [Closterium sp. NIES-68]GJP74944.1 hypothetical protein CLOP_g5454 [Closterium sp. NIES-67]GJP77461.1 hypothetical protein CLOP_g7851 [Closterium sp. NIES-67]
MDAAAERGELSDAVPPLQHLCLRAALSSATWQRQPRSLERLPSPLASALLAGLLAAGHMTPPLLEYACGGLGLGRAACGLLALVRLLAAGRMTPPLLE